MCDRIVVLIDMDCFYCQVEERLNPSLKGKPLAVVQYNQWKGGGIIAVNYEAREFGVTRHLRGDEAKQKCQDIVLIHVPAVRGKADLTKYRDAGREVVNVLCQFSDCVERASIDEAYLDITSTVEQRLKDGAHVTPSELQHTFVVGLSDADKNEEESRSQSVESWLAEIQELQDSVQLKLAIGAALVEEMRAAVKAQTGFECSAGIAHNKILSKLACGLHKPNRQTVLPQNGVNILYQTLPIKKIRSLGGKFGDVVVDQLGCTVMADLAKLSEKQLQQKFDDKTGTWLYNIARGIDNERVTQRLVAKSIGCCKKFPGKQALGKKEDIEKWLFELASEVSDRLFKDLQENKRRASLLTVSYSQDVNGQSVSSSRSGVLASYEPQKIVEDAMDLMKKSNTTPTTLHWGGLQDHSSPGPSTTRN
ncbi:DNA polymerase eta isoform X2 [Bacillus rossius redtenbacheri]|uniref:DNA polymerase eta isoform X2 n=1 Tax=Bacillus rossius redtenbacheri TaxID=93214 RepID=UPI002FDDC092